MKTLPIKPSLGAHPGGRRSERAFTMVEIAIALGVIGFAVVAIIGILPTGMNSQKDNTGDIIISQDAPYYIETIRNGMATTNAYYGQGVDFLTNYVESITIVLTNETTFKLVTNVYDEDRLINGATIVGLLSTPNASGNGGFVPVTAICRALTGSAEQQSGANTNVSFLYQMQVGITPFSSNPTNGNPDYAYPAYANAAYIGSLTNNLYDLSLTFRWPIANGAPVLGANSQTYHTMVAAPLVRTTYFYFFQPSIFTNGPSL